MHNLLMTRTTQPKRRETRTSLRGTDVSAKGVFRFSVAYFLCVLILNILVSPFVDQFWGGFLVETALLTLVFLSALLAIGGRLRTLVGVVLVAPALYPASKHTVGELDGFGWSVSGRPCRGR